MRLVLAIACIASLGLNVWLALERSRGAAREREVRETLRAAEAAAAAAATEEQRARASDSDQVARERAELIRLRGEVVRLRAGTNDLQALQREVERLRAAVAARQQETAASGPGIPPAPDGALAASRQRAMAIRCINNLKQIGLAARIWAQDDHGDVLPSAWDQMQAELVNPRVLVCPSAEGVATPRNWEEWDPSMVTYQLVGPGIATAELQSTYAECPLHGHRVLVDGSVQAGQRQAP